jgi:tetratricopeptide (TPR) repeat protein
LNYTCGLGYLNFFDTTDRARAEAKAAIENAVRLAPDEPSVIRSLGDFHYFMQRDYPRAMEQYEKFARLQPNEPTVYYSVANVLRRQARWAETAANYRKAIQLDPGDRRPARQLVRVLNFCRRFDEAIAEQRRFVALWPDALGEKYVLALLAFNARGSTKEMDEFLASLPPANLESEEMIGYRKAWARMRGDFSEAIRLNTRQLSTENVPAIRAAETVDAAATLAAHGDMTAACAQLKEASADLRSRIELDPANAVYWSDLGRMEAILGHREEAVRCAGKAMQLLPESLDALTGPSFRAALAFVHTWTGD